MDKAEKKSKLFGLLGRNISYSFSRGYFADKFKNEKIEVVTLNGLSPYIGPKILNEVQYV